MEIILAILLGLVLLAGFIIYLTFNRLTALKSRYDQAMADTDVQLRYRHDLIPNIVQTVHNFAGQEKHLIDSVVAARAMAAQAINMEQRLEAETAIGNSLNRLIAAAETYPELQSSSHFASLRAEISDVENKLAASRRFLNLAASEFNTKISQFPGVIIGPMCGLSQQAFFNLGQDRMFFEDAPVVKPI